jgi:hypothetical protein
MNQAVSEFCSAPHIITMIEEEAITDVSRETSVIADEREFARHASIIRSIRIN